MTGAPAPGRLVAVGDSFSCGVGVGVQTPVAETWVGLLAAALGLELHLLASPGVASAEVLRQQVPVATTQPGEIATLLVGLNDVVRAAFVPERTSASVHAILGELQAAYPVVLVARLHDAVALLPLPAAMRRRYVRRIAAVNAALDAAAAAHERVTLLDLGTVPALGLRCAWAVDRVHPNRYGHHAIAAAALAALGGRDAALRTAVPFEPATCLRDELRWFLASGGPWLARRLPKVALAGRVTAEPVERCAGVELPAGEPLVGREASGVEQPVQR